MYGFLATTLDKTWHCLGFGSAVVEDALEVAAIARGVSREALEAEPSLITIINTNSPLRLDGPMGDGLIAMAEAGQAVVATPFTLAGAMTPVTLAGAIAQQNAEALFCVVLTQVVRPGAPVVYGAFTSNVDMRTGSPAFGTPEYVKGAIASGQMARRYGLPWRSSNATASVVVDAQAAYESEMAVWGAVMGGVNLLYQGAGWLEGGLTASYEKLIVDAEILQMLSEVLQPVVVDEASLGVDAIAAVGPGGHFFGSAHTLERFETAFYRPMLSDWRNYETWADDGREDRDRPGEHHLEAAARGVRAAADRGGSRRGDRRVRRAAQARDRRRVVTLEANLDAIDAPVRALFERVAGFAAGPLRRTCRRSRHPRRVRGGPRVPGRLDRAARRAERGPPDPRSRPRAAADARPPAGGPDERGPRSRHVGRDLPDRRDRDPSPLAGRPRIRGRDAGDRARR